AISPVRHNRTVARWEGFRVGINGNVISTGMTEYHCRLADRITRKTAVEPSCVPRFVQAGLFDKAAALENLLNERRKRLGRDPAFLHVRRKPLADACALQQLD